MSECASSVRVWRALRMGSAIRMDSSRWEGASPGRPYRTYSPDVPVPTHWHPP